VINEVRLRQKQQHIQTLRDGIRIPSRSIEESENLKDLNWLATFAKGLALLDDYDHEQLDRKGRTVRPSIYPDLAEYHAVVEAMKADFHSAVFGKEKDESFQSAIAQIGKGFGEEDFYPSVEEKAATLLYLIIKMKYSRFTGQGTDEIKFNQTGGVDRVVNAVGGSAVEQSVAAVDYGGEIATMGMFDLDGKSFDYIALMSKGASIRGTAVGSLAAHKDFVKFIEANYIKPPIDQVFNIEYAKEAYQAASSRDLFGKIVIQFDL
jgi:hypothetical protein